MEKAPISPEEKELSFEDQLALAKNLFQSVDDRNLFVERQGGFDTFAEAGQYAEGMRESYDRMEDAVVVARAEFDTKVVDKKAFMEKLKGTEDENLAPRIAAMFEIPEEKKAGIFSRVFGKRERK